MADFRVAIGDWSGDGHSQCDYVHIRANKTMKEVQKAYNTAKKELPDVLNPENFCSDFEDSRVPSDVIDEAEKLGCTVFRCIDDEGYGFYVDEMADYVMWFLKQGDPELTLEVIEPPDTLKTDGFIGYGLFSM